MDKRYSEIYKQVQKLRFKIHDLIDNQAHPLAAWLKREIQRLEDEFEMSKSPRSLEDRMKAMQQQLRRLDTASETGQGQLMNPEHADLIHDQLEDLRMALRRMPHY